MSKFILFAAALVLSINANAQGNPHICALYGSVYENAAHARDHGAPPKMALDILSAYKEIPLANRKKAINLVYFDPRFTYAGGHALEMQVYDLCMYGPSKYKPLK